MKDLYQLAMDADKLVSFAIKKNEQRGCTQRRDALGQASLQNIKLITSSFMSKHIPLGEIVESYNVRLVNSSNKRSRSAGTSSRYSPKQPARAYNNTKSNNNNNNNKNNNTSVNLNALPPAAGTREYYERHRTNSTSRQARTNSNNNYNKNMTKNNSNVASLLRKSGNTRRYQCDNTRKRW